MKPFLSWLHERVKHTLARRGARGPRPFQPRVEALEDRALPTFVTWTGNALFTGNWTAGGNWLGGHAPNPGDDLVFPAQATAKQSNTNNFPDDTNFHSITFTGGDTTNPEDYILRGNSILLGSLSASDAGGVANAVGFNTIALPLDLAGSSASFNSIAFAVAPGTSLAVSGAIDGHEKTSLLKGDRGTLILSGKNTYSSQTFIVAGTLRAENDDALGASGGLAAHVLSGATLELDHVTMVNKDITLEGGEGFNGNGVLRASGGPSALLYGLSFGMAHALELNADGKILVDADSALTIDTLLAQAASSPISLLKSGNGPLVLGGDSSSAINFDVSAGALEVTGNYPNGSVTVRSTARLTGTGTAPAALVLAGGHLDPGDTVSGSPTGTLTLNGNTVLSSGSFLDLRVPNNFSSLPPDQVRVNGTVNVDGCFLNVNSGLLALPLTPGTRFTLVDNAGPGAVQGLFRVPVTGAVIPDDSTFLDVNSRPFVIDYGGPSDSGNDVVITYPGIPPQFQDRTVTSPISEGGVATVSGTIVLPQAGDRFILEVNWGDGSIPETFRFPPDSDGRRVSVSHRYRDNAPGGGDFVIRLSWHDQFGLGNSGTLTVSVLNVPPAVEAGPDTHLHGSDPLNRVASFTDPGADTWTATVDYGDGSGPQELKLGPDKKLHLHHKYASPGTYRVSVTVIDDDGGAGPASFWVVVD